MVDERSLQTNGAASSTLAVNSEAGSACPLAGTRSFRNHQVDGDHDVFVADAIDRFPAARAGEVEPGFLHRRFQLGLIAEQRGVECEVRIGRVRRDRDIGQSSAEIDRLRSDDDDRLPVRGKRHERVEEHPPRSDVQRIEIDAVAH